MKLRKETFLLGALLIIGLILSGCSGVNYGTPAPAVQPPVNPPQTSGTGASTFSVNINNFAFSPSSLTIKQGDTVVWTNSDTPTHTITSDIGSELASNEIAAGQTFSHTFNTAGTFSYHCSIHSSMKATIIVQ